ncbi:carboxypeptidase-like regulatory domain-containing protein, partial [Dyadobacter sp.]|uniref:carboxypeptidase-like regulatory domain-containing protein n=1 Tax=Dyadobacter sp. TaxID=1914288 RepID=UPI003F6E7A3E
MRIICSCLLTLAMLVISVIPARAQSRQVSGKVVDETNAAVPGASVLIKGTTSGTNTNAEGAFSISVPDGNQKLTVSSIGFQTV